MKLHTDKKNIRYRTPHMEERILNLKTECLLPGVSPNSPDGLP